MKRDMDLVRQLLLEIEERVVEDVNELEVDAALAERVGADEHTIHRHLILLHEAGFIEGADVSNWQFARMMPSRITWAGHDFLDTIRDPKVWSETKGTLSRVSGTAASEVVKAIAQRIATTAMTAGLG